MSSHNMSSVPLAQARDCGCKGIRTCLLCSPSLPLPQIAQENKKVFSYCISCHRVYAIGSGESSCSNADFGSSLKPVRREDGSCLHVTSGSVFPDFDGISVVENFVTEREELMLDETIMQTPFAKSQSGRCKQDFGPKVNFKKQKLKLGSFSGLPSYSQFVYERMKTSVKQLQDFEPVEMCNLEYHSDRGAHIEPHIDDTWVWGERLVTLNLLSDSILSFTHPSSHPEVVIQVPLLQRSLLIVRGSSRYSWKHSVEPHHIAGRRLAITFRELAAEFQPPHGARGDEGKDLLEIALSFYGSAIGAS